MNTLLNLENWADSHHPRWIDYLRVVLGVFIFFKGILFMQNTKALLELMQTADLAYATMAAAHYVVFAHLFGGFLIAIGLITRWAAITQLPILLVAVFFVNLARHTYNLELGESIFALLCVCLYIFYGSGKWSIDNYMDSKKR